MNISKKEDIIQNNCKHEFKRTFNGEGFASTCLKCGYELIVYKIPSFFDKEKNDINILSDKEVETLVDAINNMPIINIKEEDDLGVTHETVEGNIIDDNISHEIVEGWCEKEAIESMKNVDMTNFIGGVPQIKEENHGTKELNKLLNTFETMTIEEFEALDKLVKTKQPFTIKCDEENNTKQDMKEGKINLDIEINNKEMKENIIVTNLMNAINKLFEEEKEIILKSYKKNISTQAKEISDDIDKEILDEMKNLPPAGIEDKGQYDDYEYVDIRDTSKTFKATTVNIPTVWIQEPDYYIKIGIKDNKVYNVDWKDLTITSKNLAIKNEILEYLKEAIEFLEDKK